MKRPLILLGQFDREVGVQQESAVASATPATKADLSISQFFSFRNFIAGFEFGLLSFFADLNYFGDYFLILCSVVDYENRNCCD